MKVSMEEAQRRLDELLAVQRLATTLSLRTKMKPIARLVSLPAPKGKSKERQLGSAKGEFTVPNDFNDPPPKE